MKLHKMYLTFVWFLSISLFCFCCRKQSHTTIEEVVAPMDFPSVATDSLQAYLDGQLSFGPRIPNTKAHRSCKDYLETHFSKYAQKVEVQEFTARRWDGTDLKGYNIIASFNPENPYRVILAAHWDSRPYADKEEREENRKQPIMGANDGASGMAVLMEIARILYGKNPRIGVDLIGFDLEDSGMPDWGNYSQDPTYTWCLGAQYWAENFHQPSYRAAYGILLDMVGVENPCFTQEATSMYYASDVMNQIWKTAASLGYSDHFPYETTGALIDDHLFVNKIAQIPMVDIIHYERGTSHHFFRHWHTLKDDASSVSVESLRMVAEVVLNHIYKEY